MRSNPPTRRSRRSPGGDSSLPIIPILIGVIVLGFVIGAGLSLAGRHDTALLAVVSPTPAVAPTLAPVTPAPTEKPTPEPTAGPTDKPTRAPATSEPTAMGSLEPRAQAVTKASPHPRAVSLLRAAPSASSAPVSAPAESTAVAATGTPSLAGATVADSAFAKLSAAVVRQYLEAVKRGDQDGAYAALGASPGSKGVALTEASVVDSQTHVGRIEAHSAANDDALVSVQLQTANGPYFGQYTVHKTDTGAAVIVQHSIVKP